MARNTVAGAIQDAIDNGADTTPNRLAGAGEINAVLASSPSEAPLNRLTARGKLLWEAYYNMSSGTSSNRYSVAGTNFRWPTTSQSNATNTFMAVEWYFGTPDYQVTDPRVFCPSFWSDSNQEVYIAGGASITVQGWAIETSTGVWTACDGYQESGVATVTNASAGAWLPKISATLTANTMYRARMTFVVSGN